MDERVQLTRENIKTVAKATGRSERELWRALTEAEDRGGTASIRLKRKDEK